MKPSLVASIPLFLIALAACNKSAKTDTAAQESDEVFATFYPITFFAGRIAGDAVPVVCPLPGDADPIFWKPSREQLAAYQSAALILTNGASFEKWLQTASLSPSKLVDTGAAFAGDLVRYEEAVEHRHGPSGDHSHEGIDGHTWLDPVNAIAQAEAIRTALSKRWPEHADGFATNCKALTADLQELQSRFESLGELPPLLASHPAYNYLAERFGWDIDNLDLDPESMPTEDQLADIAKRLETHRAPIILWEAEPLPAIAAKLESDFGLRSVVFSPCELLSIEAARSGEDYLSVMEANLDRLAAALKTPAAP